MVVGLICSAVLYGGQYRALDGTTWHGVRARIVSYSFALHCTALYCTLAGHLWFRHALHCSALLVAATVPATSADHVAGCAFPNWQPQKQMGSLPKLKPVLVRAAQVSYDKVGK
jgi:hypothetical protein